MGISAVLITKDEEDNLGRCLQSLQWADEIIVVDSGSQDRTAQIARLAGAKVLTREFDTFSNQKNFAIDQASHEWVLSIDADEVCTDELRQSLCDASSDPDEKSGFYISRKNYNFGKYLRFGGQGPEKILRFFKRSKGRFEQPIHETVVVNGEVGELSGELTHLSTATLKEHREKMDHYTNLEAKLMKERGVQPSWVHENIIPLFRFLYFYVLRLGFLDGAAGFMFQLLSSRYYAQKYVKLRRLQKEGEIA